MILKFTHHYEDFQELLRFPRSCIKTRTPVVPILDGSLEITYHHRHYRNRKGTTNNNDNNNRSKTKRAKKRKQKQQQISQILAKDLRLVVYAPQTKPFPGSLTYEHLNKFIVKEKYKITYTADKSMKEIINIINNNQIRFLDTD